MREFTIRESKPEEAIEITNLIERVFKKFIAPEYSANGVQHFHEFITPEAIGKRLGENSIAFVACYQEQIVGVIEIRNFSHIALLFTSEDWHGSGVARRLVDEAVVRCREENKALKQLTVNSSPYAIPVYEKLGFTISNQEQVVSGIRFTPMSKTI